MWELQTIPTLENILSIKVFYSQLFDLEVHDTTQREQYKTILFAKLIPSFFGKSRHVMQPLKVRFYFYNELIDSNLKNYILMKTSTIIKI